MLHPIIKQLADQIESFTVLPEKPGTIYLTRDAKFYRDDWERFYQAGGRVVQNGFRIVIVPMEAPTDGHLS